MLQIHLVEYYVLTVSINNRANANAGRPLDAIYAKNFCDIQRAHAKCGMAAFSNMDAGELFYLVE